MITPFTALRRRRQDSNHSPEALLAKKVTVKQQQSIFDD
jgi:hypothetical protein